MTGLTLLNKLKERNIELHGYMQTDVDLGLAFCKWNGEYVVWRVNTETGDTFWGHYFKDYDSANEYFKKKMRYYQL